MYSLILNGHLSSCRVPLGEACKGECESSLYLYTGLLALIAGIFEGSLGILLADSAVVLTDAVHALIDATADFFGRSIVKRAKSDPKHDKMIRARGRLVIAGLLLLSALFIVYELLEGKRIPNPFMIMVAGLVTAGINGYRWLIMDRANRLDHQSTRIDLLLHARSDIAHSLYVFATGLVFQLADWTGLSATYAYGTLIADKILAMGVIGYMSWQAWKIFRGKHHH